MVWFEWEEKKKKTNLFNLEKCIFAAIFLIEDLLKSSTYYHDDISKLCVEVEENEQVSS